MPTAPQWIEKGMVRALSVAPRPVVRVLAGRPIRIEGQELDPLVQVAVRLEGLTGGFEPAPVEEVRALRRRDA